MPPPKRTTSADMRPGTSMDMESPLDPTAKRPPSKKRSWMLIAAPKYPKGDGHHYHRHKDFTPAAHNASLCIFPDLFFAIIFVIVVLMQLYFALTYGIDADNEDSNDTDEANQKNRGRKIFKAMTAASCAVAVLMSLLFVQILNKCGTRVIKALIYASLGIIYAMAYCLHIYGLPFTSYVCVAFATVILLYFCCHQGHLEFAGACLEISCEIILRNPMIEVVALAAMGLQIGWAMVFATALIGLQVYLGSENTSTKMFFSVWICIVMAYYWGQQTIRNIVVCTTAGTTASWWFNRESTAHPVMWALCRSCTRSLGAIAFGSFLAAVIQTIVYFCNKIGRFFKRCGLPTSYMTCLLRCLLRCVEIFNFYVFIIVGIYGQGFFRAGAHVVGIFSSKGLLLVEEGSIISMVLLLGQVAIGLTTGSIGASIVDKNPELVEGVSYAVVMAFLVCGIVGWGIAQTIFSVVETANAAVFICYIENPHALHIDHREAYQRLHRAWIKMGREEVKHDYAGHLTEKDVEIANSSEKN